jgi:hypothetical protein
MIPVFQRSKTIRVLDRVATGTNSLLCLKLYRGHDYRTLTLANILQELTEPSSSSSF